MLFTDLPCDVHRVMSRFACCPAPDEQNAGELLEDPAALSEEGDDTPRILLGKSAIMIIGDDKSSVVEGGIARARRGSSGIRLVGENSAGTTDRNGLGLASCLTNNSVGYIAAAAAAGGIPTDINSADASTAIGATSCGGASVGGSSAACHGWCVGSYVGVSERVLQDSAPSCLDASPVADNDGSSVIDTKNCVLPIFKGSQRAARPRSDDLRMTPTFGFQPEGASLTCEDNRVV
eukprot:TRINITY_DN56893_c0_g1_i1.p1 TRINITY_DN56893_c0_g1~~TRINITY_DN56893_c0_g1_i1.p1  ORF type:complete len:235 (-),score=36.89 TRINITY_DN56893_c0_g1_i1:74-778(-)